MTEQQYLILLGTVWIAPHLNNMYALILGGLLIFYAFKVGG
jgi:hypothetical protein